MDQQPAAPLPPASLDDVRERIDAVDRELARLLVARTDLVRHAVRFKRTEEEAQAPDRVEQVVANARRLASEQGGDHDLAEHVYRAMIAWFIAAERRALTRETTPGGARPGSVAAPPSPAP